MPGENMNMFLYFTQFLHIERIQAVEFFPMKYMYKDLFIL